eukprot:2451877-Pyramimonas_sp.AAC.1
MPKWRRRRHANTAAEAYSGVPYEATNRVRGVPRWGWAATRTLPLGPSVESPNRATKRVRGVL